MDKTIEKLKDRRTKRCEMMGTDDEGVYIDPLADSLSSSSSDDEI